MLKDADFVAFRYSRAVTPNVTIICVCAHVYTQVHTHTHTCAHPQLRPGEGWGSGETADTVELSLGTSPLHTPPNTAEILHRTLLWRPCEGTPVLKLLEKSKVSSASRYIHVLH